MELLYLLESIRTSFGDTFFSLITHLGEETFFILLGLVFFWCVNKREGYYLLSVGLLGTVINQFLKLVFRIPRPWVLDKDFTIVESARAEATGYSFPSGHTQSSVGVFGGMARWNKHKALRVICIALCVLVPFSRMYLGVHTPLDVGVSIIIAIVLIFIIYPVISKSFDNAKVMRVFFLVLLALASGYMLFVNLFGFPADVDAENLEHGIKNAYKMLGCIAGLWITYEIDRRFINFETKAVWWVQILKLVIGIIPLLAIKEGLRAPLSALFGGSFIADGVRYFLIVLFAGCIWPFTFKFFSKLSKKGDIDGSKTE